MKILSFTFLVSFYCFSKDIESNNEDLFESSIIEPVRVIKKSNIHYFFDFGKAAFGTLTIKIKLPLKNPITVQMGEKIINKSTIDSKPVGTIRYHKVIIKDIPINEDYIVKLEPVKRHIDGRGVLTPDYFGVVTPFRYGEIENLNLPLERIEVKQKVYNFRFDDNASSFTSSNTILNKVWDLCKHTIKATSFCGLYVDGDRERIPY